MSLAWIAEEGLLMVDDNLSWGCEDYQPDNDGDCEHCWAECCYLPGRNNYTEECPYYICITSQPNGQA
jgi:hypothetical protein